MAKLIQIGSLNFPTKKAAKDYIREIVSRYAEKSSLEEKDFLFVSDLLSIHPESEQKIGNGIVKIFIDLDMQYRKNKCFYVERKDGSSTDFSWLSCVDGRNVRRETFDAFRNAIENQIENFRAEQLKAEISCPYTGESLHKGNSHVDHQSPRTFYSIVNDFLASESKNLSDVIISEPKDNQFTATLIEQEFINRWQEYHKCNAVLRVISQKGNLSHAKKS